MSDETVEEVLQERSVPSHYLPIAAVAKQWPVCRRSSSKTCRGRGGGGGRGGGVVEAAVVVVVIIGVGIVYLSCVAASVFSSPLEWPGVCSGTWWCAEAERLCEPLFFSSLPLLFLLKEARLYERGWRFRS